MKFRHLNLEERERFYALKEQGMSLRNIAKNLGRSQSSLTRELKRNIKYGNEYFHNTYLPCKAQSLADKRAKKQRQKAPLKNPEILVYVRNGLRQYLSPETVAGRLSIDHPELSICHETIYQYIYSKRVKSRGMQLEQYLTFKRKKRMRQNGRAVHRVSKIPEAISIEKRPEAVNRRKQVGHWETDNMIGKQSDKTALSVTVERVLHVTHLAKVPRTASGKTNNLIVRFNTYPLSLRRTLTTDNESENTYHQKITKVTGMPVYFCHAYHSWEKGMVENTNGIIRRFIPKGVSIDTLSEEYIADLEFKLNSTPRKCLNFYTPYEMMHKLSITHKK